MILPVGTIQSLTLDQFSSSTFLLLLDFPFRPLTPNMCSFPLTFRYGSFRTSAMSPVQIKVIYQPTKYWWTTPTEEEGDGNMNSSMCVFGWEVFLPKTNWPDNDTFSEHQVHLNQPQAPYPKRIKLSSPLPLPPQLSRLVRQQKAYTPSSLSETLKPLSRRRMINREWKERWGSLNRVQLPLVMVVGGSGKKEKEIEKLGKRLLRGLEYMSGGDKVGNIPRRLKGKDIEPLERSEKNVEVEVKPRKLRRLYKRLLDKIPWIVRTDAYLSNCMWEVTKRIWWIWWWLWGADCLALHKLFDNIDPARGCRVCFVIVEASPRLEFTSTRRLYQQLSHPYTVTSYICLYIHSSPYTTSLLCSSPSTTCICDTCSSRSRNSNTQSTAFKGLKWLTMAPVTVPCQVCDPLLPVGKKDGMGGGVGRINGWLSNLCNAISTRPVGRLAGMYAPFRW